MPAHPNDWWTRKPRRRKKRVSYAVAWDSIHRQLRERCLYSFTRALGISEYAKRGTGAEVRFGTFTAIAYGARYEEAFAIVQSRLNELWGWKAARESGEES